MSKNQCFYAASIRLFAHSIISKNKLKLASIKHQKLDSNFKKKIVFPGLFFSDDEKNTVTSNLML
jgi:hypothetical protein